MTIQENVKNIMERTQNQWTSLTKDEKQKIIIKYYQKRKCQYFGHIIRGDGVQRLLMEGRINGRRGRGRPRTVLIIATVTS